MNNLRSILLLIMGMVFSVNGLALEGFSLTKEHFLLGETKKFSPDTPSTYHSTDLIQWTPNLRDSTILKTLYRIRNDDSALQACVVVRKDLFKISDCTASTSTCTLKVERNGVLIDSTEIKYWQYDWKWSYPFIFYRNSMSDDGWRNNSIMIQRGNEFSSEFVMFAEKPIRVNYELETNPKAISKAVYEQLLPNSLPRCSVDH